VAFNNAFFVLSSLSLSFACAPFPLLAETVSANAGVVRRHAILGIFGVASEGKFAFVALVASGEIRTSRADPYSTLQAHVRSPWDSDLGLHGENEPTFMAQSLLDVRNDDGGEDWGEDNADVVFSFFHPR